MEAESIVKSVALGIWRGLPDRQKVEPEAIVYKHKGSTIDEDGIRICGSKPFIESVLSNLKDILAFENGTTRIGIAWSEIVDKDTKEVIKGRYRCSVQVHERGREAQIMNAIVEGARKLEAVSA